MEKIQVFILTHNRPEYILNSIKSVLNQTYSNIELIVSDNSTDNKTKELLSKSTFKKKIIYNKRETILGPIEHLNYILKEVTSSYFMIFHDDDKMYENMVEKLYHTIISSKNIVAVGANAYLEYSEKITTKKMLKTSEGYLLLKNNIEVAKQYLIRNGIAPFPSYLYKKEVARKLNFVFDEGGVFSDMTFIMKTATLGSIILIEEPLMDYYVHTSNEHVPDFFIHYTKVINFIRKNTDSRKNSELLKAYRIKAIHMELKQGILNNKIQVCSSRYLRLLYILFQTSFFNFFPRILIISLLRFLNISTMKMKISKHKNNK